mgnify:CR=1 FL=1
MFENAHTDSINDVKFGPDGNLLISTSDDGHFKIWDLRCSSKQFTMAYKAAPDDGDSLCVGQFNPNNHNIFAVAGSGKSSALVNRIEIDSRALVVTYTEQNTKQLRRRIIQKFGFMPAGVRVYTYFTFLYSFCFNISFTILLSIRSVTLR